METDTDTKRPHLAGLDLRAALVVMLLDRGRPTSTAQMAALILRSGFDLGGRPGKVVSDALRWEVGRGRVRRIERGIYGPGAVAKATKYRMRARVAATRNQTNLDRR